MQSAQTDLEMTSIVCQFWKNKKFLVSTKRLTKFSNNAELIQNRLYKSNAVPHKRVDTEDVKRKKCVLCTSTNRNSNARVSSMMCKTCSVPLCVTTIVNVVCYKEWHTATDLNMSHNEAQKHLKATREKKYDCP